MFVQVCRTVYSLLSRISFDAIVWTVWGSYFAMFIAALIVSLLPKAKGVEKRPFLALTNAYSGVNLAVFLLKCALGEALIITAIFWVVGYLLYGILCMCHPKIKKSKVENKEIPSVKTVYTQPTQPANNLPAAKSNIKLDHAVSVTDSLLKKNLSRSDRQELEKLKNTLAVLQIKGTLSPSEADILNENFNALLKLMAKYNA